MLSAGGGRGAGYTPLLSTQHTRAVAHVPYTPATHPRAACMQVDEVPSLEVVEGALEFLRDDLNMGPEEQVGCAVGLRCWLVGGWAGLVVGTSTWARRSRWAAYLG